MRKLFLYILLGSIVWGTALWSGMSLLADTTLLMREWSSCVLVCILGGCAVVTFFPMHDGKRQWKAVLFPLWGVPLAVVLALVRRYLLTGSIF